MKKLINKPEDVVVVAMRGIEVAHADVVMVYYDPNYITHANARWLRGHGHVA